jgi:anti-sigma-K factor RskA
MSRLSCAEVRDRLPDVLARGGEDGEIRAHLEACADCRAEAALVASLRRHAPAPPPGLHARVVQAVQERPVPVRPATMVRPTRWRLHGTWQWAAAASVVVALGAGALTWTLARARADDAAAAPLPVESSLEAPLPEMPAADGMVAGAAVLDGLTDAQLKSLLAELKS